MVAAQRGRRNGARGLGRLAGALAALVVAAAPAAASQLLAPTAGARDGALTGATGAAPTDLMSAFFQNPAGLALLGAPQATVGGGLLFMRQELSTDFGYHETTDNVALAPSAGVALPLAHGLTVGFGIFGAVGSKFDFKREPDVGVPRDSFTELGVVTLAPTVAWQPREDLAIGVELNPLFGDLKNHVPTPDQSLRWRLRGPGVQATLGLLYRFHPQWRVGLTYKTPGKIWMRGTVGVAGQREDLHFDFDVPQQFAVSLAWQPLPTLTLMAFGRWTDTSTFEHSTFRFQDTPALDSPFAPETQDVYRWGAGVEWRVHPRVALRSGVARGQNALEPRSVSPLLVDFNDLILGAGGGIDVGSWTIDLAGGIGILDDRKIDATEARAFPGRFGASGTVAFWQLTRRF
ncbi:MAG: outer membrane protein transport protein [Deltaproteobacteria bacterium]|nr:outer membrane protein transport protein [Deltaproteobacteria bacterium]